MRFGLVALVCLLSATAHAQQPEPNAEETEAEAPADGKHCALQPNARWVLYQVFGAQTNPEGGENTLRLGACFPLVTTPGILFAYTNFEVGLVNYLSPAFAHLGPYVQLTPLSPLQLRIEASGFVVWPLGLPRAGYYDVAGYDAPFAADDLPASDAEATTGVRVDFVATLRLRIPIVPELAFIGLSLFQVGYWYTRGGDHYLNLRWDVLMAREDWILANEAFFGFETPILPDFGLRYGGFDSFRYVPANDYVGHQLGLFVMGFWPRPDTNVYELQPFIRAGYYLDHGFRGDSFSVLAGVITQYDLGPI